MACAGCDDCLMARLPEGGAQVGHEIHITVAESSPSRLSDFRAVCERIGIRAHAMEIIIDAETSLFEMMTGSSIQGSDAAAVRELVRIADLLDTEGWDPVRVKIESVPWHPRAPQVAGAEISGSGAPLLPGTYWESHVGLWITEEQTVGALPVVQALGGYLSINRGKPPRESGKGVQFRASATLRSVGISRYEQEQRALQMRHALRRAVSDVDTDVRTEFTWLDMAEEAGRAGGPPLQAAT